MILTPPEISSLSQLLDCSRQEAKERERLTALHPELSLEDAYRIQDEGILGRYRAGEKYRGMKMGFTSQAKMDQMGLRSPIYGVLTDRMEVEEGGTFRLRGMIHPKIEPEIAFQIGREIRGKLSFEEALSAISSVSAAMEILDSRYVGFKYFSLPDVVADNCSSAYFVPGRLTASPLSLPLDRIPMSIQVDGATAHSATSAEILGNPVHSLMKLCEILDSRGLSLPAGSFVLAGAATQAIPMTAGSRITLDAGALGKVSISIIE